MDADSFKCNRYWFDGKGYRYSFTDVNSLSAYAKISIGFGYQIFPNKDACCYPAFIVQWHRDPMEKKIENGRNQLMYFDLKKFSNFCDDGKKIGFVQNCKMS